MIEANALPMRIKDLGGWPKLADHLALQEEHYIEQVLKACRGDKTQAAKVLDIPLARLG